MMFAYGFNTAAAMLVTSIMLLLMAIHHWKWSWWKIAILIFPFLLIDFTFTLANFVKIFEGAWYTVIIASLIIYLVTVWRKGSSAFKVFQSDRDLKTFLADYEKKFTERIPKTAIFMCKYPNKVPLALIVNLYHNKFLHEKMLFISIITTKIPFVEKDKFTYESFGKNFIIKVRYGFKEIPDINKIISWTKSNNLLEKNDDMSFFLIRATPVASNDPTLSGFSEILYILMSKLSLKANEFFKINYQKVMEIDIKYDI